MGDRHVRVVSGIAIVGVFLAFIAASPASGQVLYGGITGTVSDSTGGTVPAATVTITHKETNLSRETVTNDSGIYTFTNVQAGAYDIKVALTGFREFVQTNVPVSVNQISRVDVKLDIGALAETVTVQSAAELLQTDKADVHTELKSAEITSLPLNQFRNYQALINLVPGATPGVFQNAETDTPARSLSTNVNGQNRNNNGTRTDGATNINIWLPHHNVYISPAETIDTVNVSTNNFDAEQGMAGGAAVTVITKSGTNQLKGSAFEFYNSDKLNATPYFFGNDPNGKPGKPPVTRNVYGGTVGGPIQRNRLFFFASFEGYKQNLRRLNPFSVPNAALRVGDFSNARNANGSVQVIYDPLTGNPDGTGRTPFPNNVIPADRIHSISQKLLGLYPLPNSGGTGAGNLTNNYYREEQRTTDRDNYDVKINFNRTPSHQIWGKFSHMRAVVDDLTYYLIPEPTSDQDGGRTKVYLGTFGQTWTLGPTLVWDTTVGFSRQPHESFGADYFKGNYGLDYLGIPGTNDQGIGDERYAGFPQFETGFTRLGNNDTWTPVWRDERVFSVSSNLTKVKGRHDLRAGYSLNFLWLNHWQPEVDNPRGRFDFATGTTSLRGGAQTGNFYNQYASFLLGLVSNARKSIQHELLTGREWQHGLFIRDRWQANPKLTLDLGLRWEYYPIMQRRDRGIERVDLDTLEVLLGGRGGNPTNLGFEAGKDNFAPRVGAVYRLNDNNVFRTGYGITYNPLPWTRPMRGQYPLTIAANFLQNEPFSYFNRLDQGIPIIALPDLNTGRLPLPAAVSMRTPKPGDIDRGTIQSWNVAYERRLPLDIAVDVAYVGTRGDGGYMLLDINAPTVIGGGNASRPYARAPFARNTDLTSMESGLETRYHSLQIAINRPFTKGLLIKGAYTLSKAENMADDDGATVLFNTPSEFQRNFALAGFDRTHNFHLAAVYQLPWQSGNGHSGIARAIINDWQLNGTFAAFSGAPFHVTANGNIVNTPSNQQTADLVGDVTHVGEIGASGFYYDPAAWAQPQGIRFGNTGRNQFRGPGGVNLDMSLFRSFPMGGARRLEFRVEGANITNTPKFRNPENSITSGSFMRITDIAASATTGTYFERQIRFGLRFSF